MPTNNNDVLFLQIDLNNFKCPISQSIMKDPVIANDGHTYEREQITIWLQNHRRSPVTNENMTSQLLPNHQLKALISALYDNNVDSNLEEQYQPQEVSEELSNIAEAESPNTFFSARANELAGNARPSNQAQEESEDDESEEESSNVMLN